MKHQSEKIFFTNRQGEKLAGRLEFPIGEKPKVFALFAHCFTCSKDIMAASRISRALCEYGIAVLRFDFTGLGNSDGDFANTNFSSNVDDLVCAAEFLRAQYMAPTLLIGHSLGGAAVLVAAKQVFEAKGVITIGAPSDASHVQHIFKDNIEKIEKEGVAKVDLAGREFTIKQQFIENLREQNVESDISSLKRALLIFHSPTDQTVSVDHAQRIYKSAKHPKSFISLDGADHLLTKTKDSEYVARVLSSWASRYIDEGKEDSINAKQKSITQGEVHVEEIKRPYVNRMYLGKHTLLADEPKDVGGFDLGPAPYDFLLAGLGACTNMTLRMYADRKGWPLDKSSVQLRHSKIHGKDCQTCETEKGMVDEIERVVELVGDLTRDQRDRLFEIADRCPVHRTLHSEVKVITREG